MLRFGVSVVSIGFLFGAIVVSGEETYKVGDLMAPSRFSTPRDVATVMKIDKVGCVHVKLIDTNLTQKMCPSSSSDSASYWLGNYYKLDPVFVAGERVMNKHDKSYGTVTEVQDYTSARVKWDVVDPDFLDDKWWYKVDITPAAATTMAEETYKVGDLMAPSRFSTPRDVATVMKIDKVGCVHVKLIDTNLTQKMCPSSSDPASYWLGNYYKLDPVFVAGERVMNKHDKSYGTVTEVQDYTSARVKWDVADPDFPDDKWWYTVDITPAAATTMAEETETSFTCRPQLFAGFGAIAFAALP